ncbi:ferric reductase-like transmembrane domain-containing protein [Ancylomarina longa]|nr:ferric reductase-like transmembrane domain-containing protein [Ancylomarina longa]
MRKNWAWILVVIIAIVPLINIFSAISLNFTNRSFDFILFDDYELPDHLAEQLGRDVIPGVKIAIHQTGEWAIRWMIAVLLISPFRIVFGTKNNLYVRQAMGISSGVYVTLHFFFFLYSEGILAVFSEFNLVFGLIASLIILILMITSNRKSMKFLKKGWKKIHRFVFVAISLSILHVVLLEKGWALYAIVFVMGLIVRYKPIRYRLETSRIRVPCKKLIQQKIR